MEWGSAALALACLAAAVLHVVRLVVRRREVMAEVSHSAMALGMAAMASPPVTRVVFFVARTGNVSGAAAGFSSPRRPRAGLSPESLEPLFPPHPASSRATIATKASRTLHDGNQRRPICA